MWCYFFVQESRNNLEKQNFHKSDLCLGQAGGPGGTAGGKPTGNPDHQNKSSQQISQATSELRIIENKGHMPNFQVNIFIIFHWIISILKRKDLIWKVYKF